jgi:multicomponent Na+:H+ antiporter subunit C
MTLEQFFGLYNYWIVIFLMMTGFYIVISSGNLIKTVIGLNIFQTSVFLLYITMGKVQGGTAPILPELHHDDHHAAATDHDQLHAESPVADPTDQADQHASDSADNSAGEQLHDESHESGDHGAELIRDYHGKPFSNPLPSVLMLTAIVVGIATTAVALALIVRIREDYGSIEEDDILEIDRAAS